MFLRQRLGSKSHETRFEIGIMPNYVSRKSHSVTRELTDDERVAIKPLLPNKARGIPRVNDRRVLNDIFWVLRSGAALDSAGIPLLPGAYCKP